MDPTALKPLNSKPALQRPANSLLTKVLDTPQLFDEKRKALLKQMEELSALGKERFKSIGLGLAYPLAHYYQSLPDSANSYYSQPGGMLDYALNRAEAALSLFKEHILLNRTNETISEEKKLWQYALYSAALLKGIGKLYVDLVVDIYDPKENFLKTWEPLTENLASVGGYYYYEFQKDIDKAFRCRLSVLLGRSLMPKSGFAWIASNPDVLAAWLAALQEDFEAAGVLGSILVYADAIAIQREIQQLIGNQQGTRTRYYGRVSTFGGGESVADTERTMGLDFLQWLQKALDTGQILVNQAPLQMVPGGLVMLPDTFKLFVREHPEFKNWQAVQNGFLSLGLGSAVTADGTLVVQYGVLLPKKVHVGSKQGPVSTLAFIHQKESHAAGKTGRVSELPRLDDQGKWDKSEPTQTMDQRHISALWGKNSG